MQTLAPCQTVYSLYAPIDENDDLFKFIKGLKKDELHTHLSGSVSPECLRKIAVAQGKMKHYEDFLKERNTLAGRVDYDKCFKFFLPIEKILGVDKSCKTEVEAKIVYDNIVQAVESVCKQYAEDNVTYVELRTSLKRIQEGKGFQPYLDAVLKGIKRGEKKYEGIKVNLLLSLRRSTSEKDCKETLELAKAHKYQENSRKHRVVGFDLSGNSGQGDGVAAINTLKEAIKQGFPIALHIGETYDETPEQQKNEMIELNPQRVGHAVNVHDRSILGNRPLEFCPSSAYLVKMHDEEDGHPAYQDIQEGKRPVLISCDDLAMVDGLTLSHEIYRVAKRLDLSKEAIEVMLETAKSYRFENHFKKTTAECSSRVH